MIPLYLRLAALLRPISICDVFNIVNEMADAGRHTGVMPVKSNAFDAVAVIPAVGIYTTAGPVFGILGDLVPSVHDSEQLCFGLGFDEAPT